MKTAIKAIIALALLPLFAWDPAAAFLADGLNPERGILPTWQVEHLFGRRFANMGPRSLAVDADGKLYLAYGGNHLYFTSDDGTGWTAPEVVDPDWGVGQGVSLAVDANKKVHISYVDTSLRQLRYATNKTGSWVVSTLASAADIAPHTALALDSAGRPHILFPAPQADNLIYVYQQNNGEWNSYPVNTADEGGAEVSLAIDSDDNLRAAYYREQTIDLFLYGCLEYQTKDSGGWNVVDYEFCQYASGGGAGGYSAIGLNPFYDETHLIFKNSTALAYAYNPGWTEIDSAPANGLNAMSIVVDDQNQAHIVYRSNDVFRYTIHDTNDWLPPAYHTVDTSGVEPGDFISLVIDSSGHPHAAYTRRDHQLLSAWHDAGLTYWEAPVTIDEEDPVVGECTQLAFSSSGTAHLTYYDTENKWLSYARKPAGGSWNLGMAGLHTTADLNCAHSLKLNGDVPAIAYTTVDRELRYAEYHCAPICFWGSEHVADNVYYPESVSLAFTSTGKPRISFIYNNTPTLAYDDGSGWLTSALDFMNASGQTSLEIGTDERAHVAYFRSTAHDLFYVVQDGLNPLTWHDPQQVDGGNAGSYVSLELSGPLNLGRIAYTGQNGSGLKYVSQSLMIPGGSFWGTPEVVESLMVEAPVLAFDEAGQPQIYYYKALDTHLHAAMKGVSGWVDIVLDGSGMVGRGLGLAFSPLNNLPALSYFDENNGGIRFLYQLEGLYLPLVRR